MSLVFENVSYTYSKGTAYEKKALQNIDLTIGDNEFIGIIGETGSGKSTLLQLMNGLIEPEAGRILYNSADISGKGFDKSMLRQQVGLVFQYPEQQLFEENVLKDVSYGPRNMGLSEEEVTERAIEALSIAGFDESVFSKSPFELSGGEQRRAAIAGIIAIKPSILILDEPTAGLDPYNRDEILEYIRNLQNTNQISVIWVSHSMEQIAKYVDRIIVMNNGTIITDGSADRVLTDTVVLKQAGLCVPRATLYADELRARNLTISDKVITIEQLAVEIVNNYQMVRGKNN